jgi:hypothetical protein
LVIDLKEDQMNQLAIYNSSMQEQILRNPNTKVHFGLNNIRINQQSGLVSIPASFEMSLNHFKNTHGNAVKQV